MRRVTLRSLWEHKRRLISTVLAVAARRRVHVAARSCSPTRSTRSSTTCSPRSTRTSTPGRRARCCSASQFGGDSAGSPRPRRSSTTSPASRASPRPSRSSRPRLLRRQPHPRRRGRRRRRDAGPADAPRVVGRRRDAQPVHAHRGQRRPSADDEIALNVGRRRGRRASRSATPCTVSSQLGISELHARRHVHVRRTPRARPARSSADFTLAEAQRIAGAEGQLNYDPRRRRGRGDTGGGRREHRAGPARRTPR